LPFRRFRIELFIAALCATQAHALTVEVYAPDEIKALLSQHLELARAARQGEKPDAEELARLQRRSETTARDLLATEGYFSPQVESVVERVGDDWRVDYRVDPGVRTMVRKVTLTFEGDLKSAEGTAGLRGRVERSFSLKAGMPFRQADWDEAKRAVLQPLLRRSYAAARIAASEARIDPATHQADLAVVIDSGPAFFYGAVQVTGSQRYPAGIVEALNPTRFGKPYRQQDLLDYQRALDASGYFAQALVRIDPDPALAAAVPVQVTVTERKEKQLSFGVGYSTDNGARVQATFLDRDVLDDGLRLKLEARLETREQSGLAELAWPRTATGYENRAALEYEHSDIEGQVTETWTAAVSRTRKRGLIDATLSLQFQREDQTVGDMVSEFNQALSLNYAWTHRTDGRAFYPVRGHVTNLQAGAAADALLSETSFVRLYGRHTQFFRLGEKGRFILRGELGGVIASRREGIPTDFLFRAGGENSVRGYAFESLGLDVPGGVESVRWLATASLEYNHFFTRTWGAALFVDAGDAADSFGDLAPVVGVGTGVRYRSPIGPINVDVAYGEETGEYRLHFALGVEF
jgi:translocation and assembly module TamA